MRIRETGLARRDIEQLYLYGLDAYGKISADAYVVDLLDKFEQISAHPEIARERREVEPPARVHMHKAHVIIYRSAPDEVLILRVLPVGSDWMSMIYPDA